MSTKVQAGREASGKGKSSLALPLSKIRLKQLLLSLSIANLCFVTMWMEVLGLAGNPATRYFEGQAPDTKLIWALSIDVLVLTLLIFCGFVLREKDVRAFKVVGTLLIGFFSLFALYQLQRSLNTSVGAWLPRHLWVILKFAVVLIALFSMVRSQQRAWRLFRAFFFILSPLFAILALNALVLYHTVDLREVGKGRAAGMLPIRANANRVIWVIFDELDQTMVFDARPNRIELSEFDRLRAESIYANHVTTPALDTTLSIPALLIGSVVTDTKLNTSKLVVKSKDCPEWRDFNSEPNVFRRARTAGFNTAVSGWVHPYCRVMGNSLSDCAWGIGGANTLLPSEPLIYDAFYLAQWQAQQIPLVQTLGINLAAQLSAPGREANIACTRFVAENGFRMLRNKNLNLIFLHFPVPHPPGLWDTKAHRFTTGDSTYVDNLQLTDRFLGEIRRVLQQVGNWDSSTILVSGDHPYRPYYWGPPDTVTQSPVKFQPYVPFLLKLPAQHDEVAYHREFNNVISADLLLEALEGRVRTAPEAVKWLDTQITSASESKSNCR